MVGTCISDVGRKNCQVDFETKVDDEEEGGNCEELKEVIMHRDAN